MAEKKSRFSPAVLVGDGALLLCALGGLTGSFLSLYGDPDALWRELTGLDRCAGNGDLFLAWAALLALCALAVWSLPRFRGAAAGGLTGLWTLLLWFEWEDVSSGAILTCKAIADRFVSRVDWGVTFEYGTGLPIALDTERTQLFLLFALALWALVLGWAVVRARRAWLVLALTLPPLLPGLVADLYPSWPAFLALTACWCTMMLTSLCKWAAPSSRGKLTLTVLPTVAAALAVIVLAFPQEGYTRPAWARKAEEDLANLTNRLSTTFSRFDGPFKSTITYVGAAEEADLAHAGPLGYSGRTVLRVTSDYDGRLYLRGSSLAVYEDGVWKALPEGTYDEFDDDQGPLGFPLYFPSMLEQSSPVYHITVNNIGAVGACVYMPYFPVLPDDFDDAGILPAGDAYAARRQGQWEHSMAFVDRAPPDDAAAAEAGYISYGDLDVPATRPGTLAIEIGPNAVINRYAKYARKYYLDVPEQLEPVLYEVTAQYGRFPADPVEAARNVAFLLESLCTYDTDAPAAPDGADPVEYFLSESHRGYCMHFASAATLMLRSLGIPARYVSGFTAESVPDRRVDVPDRAAHAWVEVWVGGFGWYPVEVTPAAAFEWYEQGIVPGPDDQPSLPPEETEAPDDEPTPTVPAPTEEPEPDASRPPDDPALPGLDGDEPGTGTGIPPAFLTALKALAVLAGLAALVWLGQHLPKRYRAKKLSGPDRNRAALDAYGYLLRMKRWGGRVNDRAVALAQKAKFSQHTLTQQELDELNLLLDRERERLCVILGPVERILFRYFWGKPLTSRKT